MSLFSLLATRRFMPLFLVQALGALNDNFYKSALTILALYSLAAQEGIDGPMLVTASAGIFIAPFFLFSALAGQLADKHDKSALIRILKAGEIGIMAFGAYALTVGDLWLMLALLFAMGTQSAFFGPIKYAILPQHLREDELLGGNALIEAATFLAILAGTIAGGLLVLAAGGALATGLLAVAIAAAGFAAALFVPAAPAPAPDLKVGLNPLRETWSLLRAAAGDRRVFLAIVAISVFWMLGATYLSQFPAIAKDLIGGDETVVTLLLTVFSVGIGVGSFLAHALLRGEISTRHLPAAALGMTVFGIDLWAALSGRAPAGAAIDALAFLSGPENWRVIADLTLLAICGGVFAVPLYAVMQSAGDPSQRARTIAANNVLNALFMTASALAAAAALAVGLAVADILLAAALTSGLLALTLMRRRSRRTAAAAADAE